jgi:hypothetical protein
MVEMTSLSYEHQTNVERRHTSEASSSGRSGFCLTRLHSFGDVPRVTSSIVYSFDLGLFPEREKQIGADASGVWHTPGFAHYRCPAKKN